MDGRRHLLKKAMLPITVSVMLASAIIFPVPGLAGSTTESINQQLNDLKKAKSAAKRKATETQNQLSQVQLEDAENRVKARDQRGLDVVWPYPRGRHLRQQRRQSQARPENRRSRAYRPGNRQPSSL